MTSAWTVRESGMGIGVPVQDPRLLSYQSQVHWGWAPEPSASAWVRRGRAKALAPGHGPFEVRLGTPTLEHKSIEARNVIVGTRVTRILVPMPGYIEAGPKTSVPMLRSCMPELGTPTYVLGSIEAKHEILVQMPMSLVLALRSIKASLEPECSRPSP